MKIIIVYGSTMGNTEMMAEIIGKKLKEKYPELKCENVTDVQPDILTDYDCIILGSSTWGEGELQDDFITFEEDLRKIDLSEKIGAIFGCGETSYELFCEAVNILENTFIGCKGKTVVESLKIDGDIQSQELVISGWAGKLLEALV